MKEWQDTGIKISRDTRLQMMGKKNSGEGLYVLRSIYLYLGFAGTFLTMKEAFGLGCNGNIILFILGIDCLLLSLTRWSWGKFCWYTWNGVMFIIGGLLWKKVVSGYVVVENCVRGELSAYYHMNLAKRKVLLPGEQGELFLILVFTLLVCVLGSMVVKKGRVAMLALVQVLFFALELLCGSYFKGMGIYLVVGSILALLAMGNHRGARNQGIMFSVGVWAGGVILCLSLLCGVLVEPILYKKSKAANQELYSMVKKTTEKMSSVMQSQNGLFGDHTPTADGSLNNYRVEQDETTDLIVTVSELPEQAMYLRGFVGDTYEGTYWHRIDENDFQKNFPQEDAAWQIQNILYRYIEKQGISGADSAKVKRVEPGGEYGYIPYGFQVPNDENLVGDSYYSSAEEILEYQGYVNWSQAVGEGAAKGPESEIETAYQEYVAQQYLKIPVNGLERLKAYCEQQNLNSVQEVIDFVVPTVKEGRPYSMELEPVPEGKDFAEYFFFDQKKGYCIHYATTAALMLRIMGVPARYVTGYLVTPSQFVETENGYTAEVPDSQAHAWVEVYRNGKGWIPLEVTPGYETAEYNDEAEKNLPANPTPEQEITPEPSEIQETVTPEPSVSDTLQAKENETQDAGIEDQEKNGSAESPVFSVLKLIGKILLYVLAVLLLAVLFVGGIWLNRRRMLRERERRFMQADCNQGIREISYGLYQMLQDAGIAREEAENDIDFAREMEEKLDILETGEYTAFIRLVQQAVYGPEMLNETQRKECLDFYHRVAVDLWKKMEKRKKFRWKYMKCYEIS